MAEKLLDISKVDPYNGAEVRAFGQLVTSLFQENGMIVMFQEPSKSKMNLVPIAEDWLWMVKENIGKIDVKYKTSILEKYEMLYIYIYQDMPDRTELDHQRFSVVQYCQAIRI